MLDRGDLIEAIPRLRGYARALTGNLAEADDLVQDTLKRALEKQSLWRPLGSPRAWLFTMMRNIHLNARRDRDHTIELDSVDESELAASTPEGATRHELDAMLAQLSFEHREILLLIGLEEMSYKEAAKVIGVPVGTVMSRLSRARERLAALMAEDDRSISSPPNIRVVK